MKYICIRQFDLELFNEFNFHQANGIKIGAQHSPVGAGAGGASGSGGAAGGGCY
jgi:hypothetical protein